MKSKLLAIGILASLSLWGQEDTNDLISSGNDLVHQNPDSAMIFFGRALEQTSDTLLRAKALNGLGNALQFKSEYDSAIATYLLALRISELAYPLQAATIKNNLGSLYFTSGRFQEASNYLNQALPVFQERRDTVWLTRCLVNLAGVDYMNKDFDSSLLKLKEAAFLADLSNNLQTAGGIYSNVAAVYESLQRYDSALIYVDKGLDILKSLQDERSIILSLESKATILRRLNRPSEAEQVYQERLDRSKSIGFNQGVYKSLQAMADLDNERGRHEEAYAALLESTYWKDSVLNEQRVAKISELEEKYEAEKRNAEIAQLKSENLLRRSERNTLLIIGVSILIILVLMVFLYLQIRKSNLQLTERNEIISKSLQEREILLQEVHHRVKNNLQVVSSLLNIQSKFMKDESAKKAIQEGRDRVQSMALIHQRLYKNDDLARIDFKAYLVELSEALFDSYNVDQDNVELRANIEESDLDLETSIQLGLIVNELVSNALKHAFRETDGGQIELSFKKDKNNYELAVSDNGKGVENEDMLLKSYGFRIVKSLVRGLSAELSTSMNSGLLVKVNFSR